jgi:hypothetical protein
MLTEEATRVDSAFVPKASPVTHPAATITLLKITDENNRFIFYVSSEVHFTGDL